jgi:hypothetical protein
LWTNVKPEFLLKILGWLLIFSTMVQAQIEEHEKNCLAGEGLACAKAAYHYKKSDQLKAYEFYRRGCDLKDESACYNMRSYDPKDAYFKRVEQALAPHTSKIKTCYTPRIRGQKYSAMQYKEKFYKADFSFQVDPEGRAKNIVVKTDLDKKFVDCSKHILSSVTYPKPEGIVPTYNMNMLLSAYE